MANKPAAKSKGSLLDYRKALQTALAELPERTVVYGECEYLRSEAATRFRDAWLASHPNGDLAGLRAAGDGRPAALADISRELSGGSLFARDKLVMVRQADKILFSRSGGEEGEESGHERPAADKEKSFLDKVAATGTCTWLLLETVQLPKNRTMGKRLAELCFLIPCPQANLREIPGWLAERAGQLGKRLDDAAMDALIRAHGTDLGILAGEVEKLALFAGDGDKIDAAMVGEFLTGTIEFDIFGFTNAIEARNAAKAVFYARRITQQGTRNQRGKRESGEDSSHRTLSMLAGTVQSLLRARVALARRTRADDFAAAEKLSPWRAAKLLEAAGNFQLPELRKMVGMAADHLRRAHDTGGDPLLSLETLAVAFTK